MGVAGQMLGQQTHFLDDVVHLLHPVGLILVQMEVVKALGDDIVNGGTLVQRGSRILEHHLDVPDHLPIQAVGNLTGNPNALVKNLTGGAGIDPDDGAANGGLAGAGFTNQREGLSLVDVKGCIADGFEGLVALAEGDVHIFQGHQHLFAGFGVNGAMLREMFCSCFLCITHGT